MRKRTNEVTGFKDSIIWVMSESGIIINLKSRLNNTEEIRSKKPQPNVVMCMPRWQAEVRGRKEEDKVNKIWDTVWKLIFLVMGMLFKYV